jgi:hypothetical protein
MANDYYEVITDLDAYTRARSGVVDAEFAGVEAGFDLLPSPTQFASANSTFVAAGGTANAITVAHPITTWASYTGKDGYKINIQITTTNTSSVTLAVDGLATKACKRNDGTALQSGDLVAAGFYDFIYDETAGYFVCPEAINGVLTDATAQAVAAAASASSASTSASTATTQASSASSSASSASTSASTATTQASNASASATLASQWASNPEDDDVTGGEFSAKHYSIKAAASAATAGANLAGQINGATAKNPPVDNDEFGIADSAASYGLKKILWSVIKSTIWTALGTLISGGTGKTTPVDADTVPLSDSADSNATKKLTWANIKATLKAYFDTLYVNSVSASTGISVGGTSVSPTVAVDKATAADLRARTSNKVVTADGIESALALVTLTDAATVAVDWSSFDVAQVSLAGNRTLGNPSNTSVGSTKLIIVKASSGTRTLTFSANYKGDIPTLTDITTTRWYQLAITCLASDHFTVSSLRAL